MFKPRGVCYPQPPAAGRGCYPEPKDLDGCYPGGSGGPVGSVLRGLLRAATSAPSPSPAKRPPRPR